MIIIFVYNKVNTILVSVRMFSPSSEVSSNRFATPIKKLKLPLCKEEVSNEGFIDKTLLK
jgi:hypothetical protein